MASSLKASTSLATGTGLRACRSLPVRAATISRVPVRSVVAQAKHQDAAFEVVAKNLSLSAVAASWAMAGNAQAATELAQVAAGDNRIGIIATLFLPALGWVGFNILGPAFNQLNRMGELSNSTAPKANTAPKKRTGTLKKRSLAGAVGLGAALSLAAVEQADAAQEVAQLAADSRIGVIALLFLPALGWVGFNILGPAFNQLNRMGELSNSSAPKANTAPKKRTGTLKKKRSVAGAVGLGAALSMMAVEQADAAQEMMQLAGDNRIGIIATLFLPALGWVGFNILQPAFNQLNRMGELSNSSAPKANTAPKKRTGTLKKRSLAGAVGLGAALSMMAVEQADAAQEVMQMAANDNRFGIIATLFLPALGWVGFNILQPAQNQLARMGELGTAPAPKASKRR